MTDNNIRKSIRVIVEDGNIGGYITRIGNNKIAKTVKPIEIKPLDISITGFKFESELELTIGLFLDLEISIENKIIIKGKIVRRENIDGKFYYGVKFMDLSEMDKISLVAFIKQKTFESIRKLREEKQLNNKE